MKAHGAGTTHENLCGTALFATAPSDRSQSAGSPPATQPIRQLKPEKMTIARQAAYHRRFAGWIVGLGFENVNEPGKVR